MSKRKDAKKLWRFRKDMRRAADADLRRMKNDLENELMMTKKRSKLIALEKKIEAIEDVQASRGIFGLPASRAANMSKRRKVKAAKAAAKAEKKDMARAAKTAEKAAAKAAKAAEKSARKAEKKA